MCLDLRTGKLPRKSLAAHPMKFGIFVLPGWTRQDTGAKYGNLSGGVIDNTLVGGMFESIKQSTADLSMLGEIEGLDFCSTVNLTPLDSALENRLTQHATSGTLQVRPWMTTLGRLLSRLSSQNNKNAEDIQSDRDEGKRLSQTRWQPVRNLRIAPYLTGNIAGPPRSCKVVWKDETLYAAGNSPGHHRDLVREIVRHFKTPDAKTAISDCTDRDPSWIDAYAEENLTLEEKLFCGTNDESAESMPEQEMAASTPRPVGNAENGYDRDLIDKLDDCSSELVKDDSYAADEETARLEENESRSPKVDRLKECFLNHMKDRQFRLIAEKNYFRK